MAERVARGPGPRRRARRALQRRSSGSADLERHAPLAPGAAERLESLLRDGRLSARGLHRVRRVARTLADLADDGPPLRAEHLDTAVSLRAEPMATALRLAG